MPAVACPSCGETDDLAGERQRGHAVELGPRRPTNAGRLPSGYACWSCGGADVTSDRPVPGDPSQTGHRALRDRRTD